jgi:hypothetical protein
MINFEKFNILYKHLFWLLLCAFLFMKARSWPQLRAFIKKRKRTAGAKNIQVIFL